jgi:hypothetical protein
VPFRDSEALLDKGEELRQLAKDEGYLFFKGLIPPDTLLNVRRQVLEVAKAHDFLHPDADPEEAIAKPGFVIHESGGNPAWEPFYADLLRLRDFHELALHPNIIGALETLFAEPVLPHPRNICRAIFPSDTTITTAPHQDHIHIGGTEETWTVWISLADCPSELGGLALLPGSHKLGILETHAAYGAGGTGVDVPEDSVWASGEITCGDVVMLRSNTVHQGRDNLTADTVRVSVDFRYQPRSHPVREDSLIPHMAALTWEEIYENWPDPDDPVKHYWKAWDLDIVAGE